VSCEVRTGFYIPEDDILHSDRHENLKSYIALGIVCRVATVVSRTASRQYATWNAEMLC
jgi:hypothetical protein